MVLDTTKNVLLIKDTLKTFPFRGINNYIKIGTQRSRKTTVNEVNKMEKDKIVLEKVPPVFYL